MTVLERAAHSLTASRLWRSFFRHGMPDNPMDRSLVMTTNLFFHLHPVKVSLRSLRATYSFGLGVISTVLFLTLTVTGVLLVFYYVPATTLAYSTMKDLQTSIPLGQLARNMHRWAAHLMVLAVALHMVRVFYTGAYKPPREFNWIVGVFLLIMTLGASFTGYLLPWDQLSYWAITVGTNIASYAPVGGDFIKSLLLGGSDVGQNALIRFYTLHIAVVPLVMIVMISVHLWRVRKDGGLAAVDAVARHREHEDVPANPTKTYSLLGVVRGQVASAGRWVLREEDYVDAIPHLVRRLLIVWSVTVLVVVALGMFMPAPLEEPANALVTPNPAKAPWYFLWLQELVTDTTVHIGSFTLNGALVGGILLPGVLVLVLAVWPWLDRSPAEAAGVWLHRARRRQNLVFLGVVCAVVVLTIVGTFLRGPYWNFYWPWDSWPEMPRKF